MQRRRFLAASAALAATVGASGCNGDGGDATTTTTGSKTVTDLPGFRTVIRERSDPGSLPTVDLQPSVSVLDETITKDSTARVRLTIANEAADDRTVYYRRCPPADKHVGENTGAEGKKLYLLDAEEWTAERAGAALPECWRPETFDVQVEAPCEFVPVTIPGGGEHVREFEVWDFTGNGSCLPPGPYRFTETWRPSADGETETWAFELGLLK